MTKLLITKKTALQVTFIPVFALILFYLSTRLEQMITPAGVYMICVVWLMLVYPVVKASFDPAEWYTPFKKWGETDLTFHLGTTASIFAIIILFVSLLVSAIEHNAFIIISPIGAYFAGGGLKRRLSRYFLI